MVVSRHCQCTKLQQFSTRQNKSYTILFKKIQFEIEKLAFSISKHKYTHLRNKVIIDEIILSSVSDWGLFCIGLRIKFFYKVPEKFCHVNFCLCDSKGVNKTYHTKEVLNVSLKHMYRLFFKGVSAPMNGQ